MVKYPRTLHLPQSEGISKDDKRLSNDNHFIGQSVVITEKLDGENSTLYRDYFHARSLDGRHHDSRNWLKNYHASIKHYIPQGYRICGENLFAKHSISYDNLDSYFYVFNIWNGDICLSWVDTVNFCVNLGLNLVPVLYEGIYTKDLIINIDTAKQEGYVVRLTSSFTTSDFDLSVAKWVRKGHVQTDKHWTKNWVKNTLKGGI